MSFLIAVEGVDSSGKHTQCALLTKYLSAKGTTAEYEFPRYSGPCGDLIKELLNDSHGFNSQERAKLLQSLMLADRLSAITEFPDVDYIVCDRFYMSGIVYGSADNLKEPWLHAMHSTMPRADMQILIDVNPLDAAKRRGTPRDDFERDTEKQLRIRNRYLELWKNNANFEPSIWHIVDGDASTQVVHSRIQGLVAQTYIQYIVQGNSDAAI